ncbi:MAG: dihydroorotate dehydrogenase electron transfer subunit [Candidatus Thermoplasmatota archaeon]|nr:dihydroorotate dehydrogenase electron transfer subunit [Candidatus Thermoplasmatota archaeon]
MNIPTVISIHSSSIEASGIKTITFNYRGNVLPGQFFMIWIPGVDEIPMSVSSITPSVKGITFRDIGDATNALYQLKKGDKIGVRGPFGNGFTIKGKHLLFVGGGTGIAMLAPAVEQARVKKLKTTVILGAKTKTQLFFEDRFRRVGASVYSTTDDGSAGYTGLASDLVKELLKKERIDAIYTCGPELMMKAILSYCKTIPLQASLERYMKCAIGICGQCCVGKGLRVCVDGPIFDGKTLKTIKDFGVYHRDAAGRKILF